jgi:hypothetical protein
MHFADWQLINKNTSAVNGSWDLAASPKQASRKIGLTTPKNRNRDKLAQQCVASLKDAEDLEIDEPEEFRAGSILKGARNQFGAQRGCKKREWSQELQFKKTVQAKPRPLALTKIKDQTIG